MMPVNGNMKAACAISNCRSKEPPWGPTSLLVMLISNGNFSACLSSRRADWLRLELGWKQVGAQTETELKEKKLRVEDALNATKVRQLLHLP